MMRASEVGVFWGVTYGGEVYSYYAKVFMPGRTPVWLRPGKPSSLAGRASPPRWTPKETLPSPATCAILPSTCRRSLSGALMVDGV